MQLAENKRHSQTKGGKIFTKGGKIFTKGGKIFAVWGAKVEKSFQKQTKGGKIFGVDFRVAHPLWNTLKQRFCGSKNRPKVEKSSEYRPKVEKSFVAEKRV